MPNYMNGVISAKEIGRRLKEFRRAKRLKAAEAGRRIGISRQHIYRLEAGERDLTLGRIKDFCKLYGVTVEELAGKKQKSA